MSRNGTGTFTLVAGNPVVTGTVISSTTHNNTMSDIASEITASLAKNGETVVTGSIDFNANKLILDLDGDTSITADTDDQIDIELSGADDFRFLANIFRSLSGSVIETNTINETTAASGVTIDSLLIKDGNLVPANGYGINFAATSDGTTMGAELFDDYEEGTFVPALCDSTNSDAESQAYAARSGRYTKIGNVVFFNLYVSLSSKGSLTAGDQVRITGLPFTPTAGSYSNAITVNGSNLSIVATDSLVGEVPGGTASMFLWNWSATGGVVAATVANLTATSLIYANGHYQTES